MYHDYFLRFDSEAQANSILFTTNDEPVFEAVPTGKTTTVWVYQGESGDRLTSDRELSAEELGPDGDCEGYFFVATEQESEMANQQTGVKTVLQSNYPNIDIIGVIHKPTGKILTADGIEFPEIVPIDGWHVNVRSTEQHPELDAYSVVPAAPVRVWG